MKSKNKSKNYSKDLWAIIDRIEDCFMESGIADREAAFICMMITIHKSKILSKNLGHFVNEVFEYWKHVDKAFDDLKYKKTV